MNNYGVEIVLTPANIIAFFAVAWSIFISFGSLRSKQERFELKSELESYIISNIKSIQENLVAIDRRLSNLEKEYTYTQALLEIKKQVELINSRISVLESERLFG